MSRISLALAFLFASFAARLPAAEPTLILHHGKILTVDDDFRIVEAIAIAGERIVAVGSNDEILKLKGEKTELVDLAGKMALPGLIDSHVHAGEAAMHEFDHPVPEMTSIDDVLAYIRARAAVVPEGEWISMSQIFITRLKEQRFPTKEELDAAAPKHPVVFATGPDAMLNSLALKESGIDKDFKVVGTGQVEKDPKSGEPTGMLRSCTRYVKSKSPSNAKKATETDRQDRLVTLIRDYNSVGLTGIADRAADEGEVNRYTKLRDDGRLTVRTAVSWHIGKSDKVEETVAAIRRVGKHPLCQGDSRLRIVGIKMFLDGGMLTGSAYMRDPWGVSTIYSIRDPQYRGNLFIPRDELLPMVRAAAESRLQFTAHSVGDGAVHQLLDVYEELAKDESLRLRETRPCLTHCNFMSADAVAAMARVGAVADIQPAWLYLDARTLKAQFGDKRLAYFQPLKSLFDAKVIVGGGSDHMQKIDSLKAVNPYNPWLAIWVTVTRRARWFDGQLHPEQAISRQQAIRFYTSNNAWIIFQEKELGSLEPGKLADLIVVDRDLLTCPEDDLRETQVLKTYFGGKLVHQKPQATP